MYTTILTYLTTGGGAIAALRGAWFVWTWYVARKDARKASDAVTGRKQIADAVQELRYSTPADYIQIIRIHNGGGDLKAALNMYMSCLVESHDQKRPGCREEIQCIELDDHYRQLVARLLKAKDGSAEVSQVDDELLQDIYRLMGAKYTRVCLIAARRDGIYFLRATSATAPLGGEGGEDCNIHFRRVLSALKKHY